jgi:hypothetical protein
VQLFWRTVHQTGASLAFFRLENVNWCSSLPKLPWFPESARFGQLDDCPEFLVFLLR